MKKILIAEDDKFLSSAYRVKLAKAGFEVHMASDGQEAISLLQNVTPDLILLDLIMPVKDGFATLQEIKANPAWKTIPVIVASNLGQKEDIEKSTQLGANDFVVKSDLSLDSVIEKINKLLGVSAGTASEPSALLQNSPIASVVPPVAPEDSSSSTS